MPKLTVTVITRNEAANIDAVLDSVAWADETLVVDSESTDDTAAPGARARRPRVRAGVAGILGAEELRRRARRPTTGSCRSTPTSASRRQLAGEIRALLAAEPPARGYRVPRVSFYLGRWIRTTDWYPDHQLRLYDRRAARWVGDSCTSASRWTAGSERLRHDLQHLPYRDIAHHLQTIDRYTTLAASQMQDARAHASEPRA